MGNSVEVIFDANNQTDKAFAQLLKDVKRTADGVEKMGTKGTQALDKLDKKAARTGKNFGRSVSVMAGKFLILELAITHVTRLLDTMVFDFNSKLETAGLGIASAFVLGGEYVDDMTGKVLTGQDALDAALVDADQMVKKLQVSNFQTIATLDQLIRAYQETLPVAMAKGFDRTQVEDFTVAMVQAAGAIGLQLDMLGEETRSILTGAINPRTSRIATVLGLTNADVAKFKGDAAGLFDFLMDKLAAYRDAGEESQKTWAGTWSNALDIFKQMSAMVSEPLFEGIKADLQGITDDLVSVDTLTGKIEWNQEFLDNAKQLQDGLGAVYLLLKGASSVLATFGGDAGSKWLNAIELISKLVDKLESNKTLSLVLQAFSEHMSDQMLGAGGGLFNASVETILDQLNNKDGEQRYPMPDQKPDSTYHRRTKNTGSDDGSGSSTNSKTKPYVPPTESQWELTAGKEFTATEKALAVLQEYNREKYEQDIVAGNAMPDDPWMTGEFEKGLESATERMGEMQEASDNWQIALIDGLDDLADYYDQTFSDRISGSVFDAFATMEDTLVDFVNTGKASFKDLVNSILDDMLRMTIQQDISSPLASAMSTGLSSLFGGGTDVAFGADSAKSFSMNANGNAFSNGRIIPFATGTIVTKPTYFPMSDGNTGLMGEAGEEGILPLKRVNGKLGVSASGAGGTTVNQTIAVDARGSAVSAVDLEDAVARGAEQGYQKVVADFQNRGTAARLMGK